MVLTEVQYNVFALATTRFRAPLQSPPVLPIVSFSAKSPLIFSCPFSPEGMDPDPDLFVEISAQSHVLHDNGFSKGISNLLVLPNRTLLDQHLRGIVSTLTIWDWNQRTMLWKFPDTIFFSKTGLKWWYLSCAGQT